MMSENSFSKFDTRTPKAVFLLKRRSNQRTDPKLNLGSRVSPEVEHTYNADLRDIPQPVQ